MEVKRLAGLPTRVPFCQWLPVASKKAFICEHIMPKRVGKPNAKPSACGCNAWWKRLGERG